MPFNLKVTYTIGKDTPPIVYVKDGLQFTITSEVSGEIALELASSDRFVHSLELGMCKNEAEVKLKLKEAYDPALKALTVKPEMTFSAADGKVKIESPISAEAGLGPFKVKVQALSPMQLSGTLSPSTIQGEVEVGGRKYKYSADLEFKVQVTFKPKPGDKVKEPVRVKMPEIQQKFAKTDAESVDWQKIGEQAKELAVVVAIAIVTAAGAWYLRSGNLTNQTTSISPFIHHIDLNDSRYLQYMKRNPSTI